LSPLYNPPTLFSTFEDGTVGNWVFDYSSPFPLLVAPALSVESQTVFGGNYSLEIPVPYQVASGGVTYPLTAYSVHTTFNGPVTVIDLTNRSLSMWVYWKSGIVTSPNKIGAQLFIKDTSYNYANATLVNLSADRWIQVVFDTAAPGYVTATPPDLTKIYETGLQIAGSGSAVFSSPGTIYADNFGY
jgi:hypothetical protein